MAGVTSYSVTDGAGVSALEAEVERLVAVAMKKQFDQFADTWRTMCEEKVNSEMEVTMSVLGQTCVERILASLQIRTSHFAASLDKVTEATTVCGKSLDDIAARLEAVEMQVGRHSKAIAKNTKVTTAVSQSQIPSKPDSRKTMRMSFFPKARWGSSGSQATLGTATRQESKASNASESSVNPEEPFDMTGGSQAARVGPMNIAGLDVELPPGTQAKAPRA